MSKLLYEGLLKTLKGARKKRKEELAVKAGFNCVEDYKNYLEKQINIANSTEDSKELIKKESENIPTIHIVDIIDCSGSMRGDKINNAVKAINDGIEKLKKETSVKYLYTLCHFSCYNDIKFSYEESLLENVSDVHFHSRDMTALYDAIGTTLNKLKDKVIATDKVLVNIYTDGMENNSRIFSSLAISLLIEALKSNFTVTFIGTNYDVEQVIRNLKLEESNTLKYDGTARGLQETMISNMEARVDYTKAVVDGLDVSKGFYKNIKK